MRISQLLNGIVAANLMKGVQLVAAIVLVPFLLQKQIFGLEGYGRIAAIAALTTMLGFASDGVRLSLTRSVSKAIDEPGTRRAGEALWTAIKCFGLLSFGASALLLASTPWLLPLLGIEMGRASWLAVTAALAFFLTQNLPQFTRVALINHGAISVANHVISIEVVLRTATLIAWLSWATPTIAAYFSVFAAYALARHLVFYALLRRRWPDSVAGAFAAPWWPRSDTISYAVPMTVYGFSNLVATRVPVLLASGMIGAEAAGMIAIALGTIYQYLRQVFLSGLQQIMMPVASRFDPLTLSDGQRSATGDLEAAAALLVTIIGATLVAGMPGLIPLWLGPDYGPVVLACQLVVMAGAVEIAMTLRNSLVMGQGWLAETMRPLACASLGIAAALVGIASWTQNWTAMVGVAGAFLILRAAAILGAPFRKRVHFGDPGFRSNLWLAGCVLAACGVALALSGQAIAGRPSSVLLWSAGSAAIAVVLGLCCLIPPTRLATLFQRVRRSLDRDIFERSNPADPQ